MKTRALLVGLCVCATAQAQTVVYENSVRVPYGDFPTETAYQRDARMEWFREARFGMFIHWGIYAVPAGEWKGKPVKGIAEWVQSRAQIPVAEYEPLKDQFNPVKYDADAWVRLA